MIMKKLSGFTLIELIVVIAIVGALAAILVPTMIGYMSDSHLSTANSNAKLAYTTTANYGTSCNVAGFFLSTDVSQESLKWNGNTAPEFSACENGADIANALRASMGSNSSSAGYVTVKVHTTGMPKEAWWSKRVDSKYVGHYPDEYKEKTETGLPAA